MTCIAKGPDWKAELATPSTGLCGRDRAQIFSTTSAWLKLQLWNLAALRQLILHDGRCNGRQIGSTRWLQPAAT